MAYNTLKNEYNRNRSTTTPQTEKAVKGQKKNPAGGYSFQVSDLNRAKRFVILGSEGTFYQTSAKLTRENAKNLENVLGNEELGLEFLAWLEEVSVAGRAPKQSPGLFALALATAVGTDAVKAEAFNLLPVVARTASTLFEFVAYMTTMRGWGRAPRRAVANWYESKDLDKLAYQIAKYPSRNEFTHRRLLNLAHPSRSSVDHEFSDLMNWARGEKFDTYDAYDLPEIVVGSEQAHAVEVKDLPALIKRYHLTWEMLPSEALNEPKVWEALLEGNLPLGALIRQLGRLAKLGITKPLSGYVETITARLRDEEELKRARIHPLNALVTLKTYASGRGVKGNQTWDVNNHIVAALEDSFEKSFKFVEPTGKKILLAVDISGSMTWGTVAGAPISPMEAGAAFAATFLKSEKKVHLVEFDTQVRPSDITPKDSYKTILSKFNRRYGGGTDVASPVVYATQEKIHTDAFVIVTDEMSWAGPEHVFEAFKNYKARVNKDAKLVVLYTQASKFSVVDPADESMLAVAGFDSAVPQSVAAFLRD